MDPPGYGKSYSMTQQPVTSQPMTDVQPYEQGMAPQIGQLQMGQPQMGQTTSNVNVIFANHQQQNKRPWMTGLFSCCEDVGLCCMVMFCLPCMEAYGAKEMGEHCCLPCCVPGNLIALRTKMRTEKNIQGSIMSDCCAVTCCRPCVVCQMMREHNRAVQLVYQ